MEGSGFVPGKKWQPVRVTQWREVARAHLLPGAGWIVDVPVHGRRVANHGSPHTEGSTQFKRRTLLEPYTFEAMGGCVASVLRAHLGRGAAVVASSRGHAVHARRAQVPLHRPSPGSCPRLEACIAVAHLQALAACGRTEVETTANGRLGLRRALADARQQKASHRREQIGPADNERGEGVRHGAASVPKMVLRLGKQIA